MGVESSGPRPIASRSRVVALRGAQSRWWSRDRIEARDLRHRRAVTRGRVTLRNAPVGHFDALLAVTAERGLGKLRHRHRRGGRDRHRFRPFRCATSRRSPTRAWRPIFSHPRAFSHPGGRRQPRHRDDFRGPPRVAPASSAMGAQIEILDKNHATIHARHASTRGFEIGDLRAGASLILAALAADGVTTIRGAHHVHRAMRRSTRNSWN